MESLIHAAYLVAAVLFMVGLKRMNSPATARRGNYLSMTGMALAVVATLLSQEILTFKYILIAALIGGLIGAVAARMVQMTAMPEMIAIFNGCGGAASALVAMAEFYRKSPAIEGFVMTTLVLSLVIGTVTFSGSLIAFGKLQGTLSGRPTVFPFHHGVNLILFLALVVLGGLLVMRPEGQSFLLGDFVLAFILGILLVLPIGGADMPVVISFLNSLSGVAVAMTGFVLNNNALIIVGSLVGSAGLILTQIMCQAMNRPLTNVLFGAFGAVEEGAGVPGAAKGAVKEYTVEDAVTVLENARSVIIVPGYGMAAAQAQHAVRELADLLEERGIDVRFAIHPVAGRMPGHMNVLLAEANVPYDKLYAMEDINDDFPKTDVSLVVGANDVVNPAARENPNSPIYGMPILNVDQSRTVIVLKRSMNPGFAGIENELFLKENTMMVFGDARKTLQGMITHLKS